MRPECIQERAVTLQALLGGMPAAGRAAVNAILQTDTDIGRLPVSGLCLDSRKVNEGEVFVALRGTKVDARQYICQAVAAGACAVFSQAEASAPVLSREAGCPVIAIPGLPQCLSAMAACFYGWPARRMRVVGITGTNGKTTCSHLLARLYTSLGHTGASIGTLGYGLAGDAELTATGLTTPDAIETQRILAELRDLGASVVAMEVSSHSLDQGRVAGIDFDTAVFTNLSRDHLDYHGDMSSYALAKQALFEMPGLKRAAINIDDETGLNIHATTRVPQFCSYAIRRDDADIRAIDVRYTYAGIETRVISPWGEGELRSRLWGEFNLYNLLAVIATACIQGVDFNKALSLAAGLGPVDGRMEPVAEAGDIVAVVDYAHTPDALRQALAVLRLHMAEENTTGGKSGKTVNGPARHPAGKLWCVFGCGGDRDKGKRPLMGAVAEAFADSVVLTSDNPRGEEPARIIDDILAGIERPGAVDIEVDRAAAIAGTIAKAAVGDCVLIAGKGHEDYQLIGNRRLSFCDREHARRALNIRTGGAKV